MSLTWMNNGFISKDLYAPFRVNTDNEYIKDLSKKYSILLKQANKAGADEESIKTIKKYRKKILESLNCYYSADIEKCNTIVRNLLKDIGDDPLAVSPLNSSKAFHGMKFETIYF